MKDAGGRDCLEFIAHGPIALIISASVTNETAYDRAAHSGLARIGEVANLPATAPPILFGMGRRKGASRHTFLAARGL